MEVYLNKLKFNNEEEDKYPQYTELHDFSNSVTKPKFDKVEAVFKDIEEKLIEKILEHKGGMIFGCVAWLTSESILKALAECEEVQIIVQKEDFLRPDYSYEVESRRRFDGKNDHLLPDKKRDTNEHLEKIRKLYDNIQFTYYRNELKEPVCLLTTNGNISYKGIRCVGNHNSDKQPAFPRAHHKFLVFCDVDKELFKKQYDERVSMAPGAWYKPIAVWTGSFNFTKNSTLSFENALYLEDKSGNNPIINSYLKEHHQVFGLSESLDWESKWCEPEYRIGT